MKTATGQGSLPNDMDVQETGCACSVFLRVAGSGYAPCGMWGW